ncbi:MAG: hypothetical protein V7L22_26930 [Nostoc sp.]|uniref:WD40 repeat domain-containing protein n=1 Tax=Nostoc sp. TaxID=1180 RepID=UPI002FFA8CB7
MITSLRDASLTTQRGCGRSTGKLLQEFKGHQGYVYSMSFSPDGKTIATASSDKTARLWPVENLDRLLVWGCNWLHDYLQNNSNLSERDKHLYDDKLTSIQVA